MWTTRTFYNYHVLVSSNIHIGNVRILWLMFYSLCASNVADFLNGTFIVKYIELAMHVRFKKLNAIHTYVDFNLSNCDFVSSMILILLDFLIHVTSNIVE